MSSSTAPLKYASDTDYTSSVIIFTSVLLFLTTLFLGLRFYARYLAKNVGLGPDDGLVVLGWVRSWHSVPLRDMLLMVHSLVM